MRSSSGFLGLVVAAFLLLPAAQAAAVDFPLVVQTEGSGAGTVECEVESGPAEPCDPEYPEGTEIALTADPDIGSEFVEWSGDCLGQPECEVTMDEAKLVVAVFELEEVPLEATSEGEGLGEVECEVESGPAEECEATYPFGTEITLVAEPDSGSEFIEWSGDCAGSEPCELTMDEEKSVTALFELTHFALEIEIEGEGTVECEVEGGPLEECEATYLEGTEVILVAEPDSGSEFIEWSGDCAGSEPCELTMDEEKSVTALFEAPTLAVSKIGTGSGTVTSSPAGINCGVTCEAEFPEGEEVTLTASPSIGSEFAGWSGCDAEPSETECEVTVEEDMGVSATFDLEPPSEFALTVALAGSGSGTVTSAPGSINCGIVCSDAFATGSDVTLTATPASGSTFAGWSGACSGTGLCKVTMSQSRSVTATFEKSSTPPPAAGTAVVARTAKVKGGKAQLKLTCTGEGPCKGKLKLTAKIKVSGQIKNLTIGKASFSLLAGAKKTIKVKLSGPAKKALAKGPLKAKVKGSGVRAATVKLKLAK
jgi:List-Bact-rpt repeat protein